jgi:hypothetical protein
MEKRILKLECFLVDVQSRLLVAEQEFGAGSDQAMQWSGLVGFACQMLAEAVSDAELTTAIALCSGGVVGEA